jgi:putative spermidine/putrescine transport system permease protein
MTDFVRRTWFIWPAFALLIFFFLIPSLDIIRSSVMDPDLTLKHFQRIYQRSVYTTVFFNTVKLSLFVALATAVIGYPVAYFINLQPKKQQVLLIFLIFVPMWMSILIRSYAWMVMLGRDGVVNTALLGLGLVETPAQMLYTSTAVFVAMVQILLPIQIITCYSSMTEIDMGLIRAARILGATPRQAMRRVFFPLSFEGTITGALIVFMLSMGFFITPALVGGPRDKLIGNLIEFQVERLNWGFASALGVMLLVGTLTMVVLIRFLGRRLLAKMV